MSKIHGTEKLLFPLFCSSIHYPRSRILKSDKDAIVCIVLKQNEIRNFELILNKFEIFFIYIFKNLYFTRYLKLTLISTLPPYQISLSRWPSINSIFDPTTSIEINPLSSANKTRMFLLVPVIHIGS